LLNPPDVVSSAGTSKTFVAAERSAKVVRDAIVITTMSRRGMQSAN